MKVTKEQAAENRRAIVEAAGKLFREKGFEGVGVADITRAAGLTHGGFYGHFASKDALAAEACGEVFTGAVGRLANDLQAHFDRYLTERHRDNPGNGCLMGAFTTEIPRQPAEVQASFAEGLERYVEAMTTRLKGGRKADRRRRAQAIIASLVGAMALSRATANADPDLSRELLSAMRAELKKV